MTGLNPITLPASKMLATMTTLIADVRYKENIQVSDIVNDMVDSSRIGSVDYGKGIVYTFEVDVQPVKDLTETSSAFTITKPNVAQENIQIDNYKFVPISLAEILSRDAFVAGYMVDNFINNIMKLPEKTIRFKLFDEVNNLYQTWTPGQATQTVYIDQIDTNAITNMTEKRSAEQWNATEVAKVMRKTLNNMKLLNNKYTDVATYTDVNTGETKPVRSALSYDNLKIVFNDNYYTNFLADAMASLYHSEKVGEMLPGQNFVLMPTDALSEDNTNTIAWLSDRDKFAVADFYKVTLSIQDPSTLYTNSFFHVAYGCGVFKYAPGVKFVARYIEN